MAPTNGKKPTVNPDDLRRIKVLQSGISDLMGMNQMMTKRFRAAKFSPDQSALFHLIIQNQILHSNGLALLLDCFAEALGAEPCMRNDVGGLALATTIQDAEVKGA